MFIGLDPDSVRVRLYEHQGKALLREYGIPVPPSKLIDSPEQAPGAFEGLAPPVMVKAQVLSGGRAKAGGIVAVTSPGEAEREAARIMGLRFGGEAPKALLLEKDLAHESEMYLSVSLDRGERTFVVVASASGGVEVESTGGRVVEAIPLSGLTEGIAGSVMEKLPLQGRSVTEFREILFNLEQLSREKECELAEINPLGVGPEGALTALDSKIILDDNALFRHPELAQLAEGNPDAAATKEGFAFVELDGDIAVIGNGAGLVLSTLDLVRDAGGRAACFLDLGGGAQTDRVKAALKVAGGLPSVRKILVNIFGGITNTTDVAAALRSGVDGGLDKPIFARISGADEGEARELLAETPTSLFATTLEAVEAAVRG